MKKILLINMKDERIIFHYNKAHNQDPNIPQWVIKHKGKTHYVHHIESSIGFKTKNTPDNDHTKGSLQFKGKIEIVEEKNIIIAKIWN